MEKQTAYQVYIRSHERPCLLVNEKKLKFKWGDFLVIETNRGKECGIVSYSYEQRKFKKQIICKRIIRFANQEDLQNLKELPQLEKEYSKKCKKIVNDQGSSIILSQVEVLFDRKKVIVTYTKDKRQKNKQKYYINEILQKLSQEFNCLVELKEVTIRGAAKVIGGIGTCGRILCCCSFLNEIKSVSTRFAKTQGINMNPKNLCGVCGKLKCCLRYESEDFKGASP